MSEYETRTHKVHIKNMDKYEEQVNKLLKKDHKLVGGPFMDRGKWYQIVTWKEDVTDYWGPSF